MNWKVYKVTYNDGSWHSGELPHFYYIARSEEDLIANSKKYADFAERKERSHGDIWIHEWNCVEYPSEWENVKDFEIFLSINHI